MSVTYGGKSNIPVANPTAEVTHLKVSVYYTKGGISYYDYKTYPGGIYLSVGPIAVEQTADFNVEKSTMFSGAKAFIEPAARLNRKRLTAVFEQATKEIEAKAGKAWEVYSQVAASAGVAV